MNTDPSPLPRPSFARRFWQTFKRFGIFVFRLLLTLLILSAVGAAIYFGAPILIQEYVLKDVAVNSQRIEAVSTQVEQNDDLVNERLDAIQDRLEALEIQGDTRKQVLDDLGTQLAEVQAALEAQALTQESLEALETSLDEYAAALTTFEDRLAEDEASLEELRADLETLDLAVAANEAGLQALEAQPESEDTLASLRQELELLKAMELITRARVSIGQENIGLAGDDLALAYDLLNDLSAEVTADRAVFLSEILVRLELARENLIDSPSLANKDLEVAWQLLAGGLPDETTAPVEGVAPSPTPTPKP